MIPTAHFAYFMDEPALGKPPTFKLKQWWQNTPSRGEWRGIEQREAGPNQGAPPVIKL
jgi:hypothetical protein